MNEYISRKVACNLSFSHGLNEDGILYIPYHEVVNYLQNISPADVRPIVEGEWLWEFADNGWANHICSRCGWTLNTDIHVGMDYRFCPNCGAEMTGGVNE